MAFSQSVLEHWTCFLESRATFLGFFEQTKTSMKQTNNAIKFLMAQYRAIFKNAYFKGLTTALVLTAGLAAGQAQAATNFTSTDSDIATKDLIINSDGVFVNGSATVSDQHSDANNHNIEYTTSGGDALFGNTVVINDGGILRSEGGANAGKDNLYINDSITVNDGGQIILEGATGSGGGIQGWNGTDSGSATSGALTVNAGGEVSVKNSQIQIGDIDINGEGATVTVGTNMGIGDPTSGDPLGAEATVDVLGSAESTWKDNAMIYGGNSLSLRNGAVANINAGGQMLGLNVSVNNATVNLAGTSGLDSTNGALLMAAASTTSGASLSLTGATVNVQGEDEDVNYTGHLLINPGTNKAASLSSTNTTFTIGAGNNLLIGVAPGADGSATNISTNSGGATVALNTGTIINNEGTVELTEVSSADFATEGKYVVTTLANGATINNTSADSAFVINAGNRFVMNGGVINNSGLIDIESGAVASAEEQATTNPDGSVLTDGVTTLGGNINVGGILKVGAGSTLEIASGSNLSTNTAIADAGAKIDEGSSGNGSIQVIGDADSGC